MKTVITATMISSMIFVQLKAKLHKDQFMNSVILCLCVCIYIYIYIYIHTHTHTPEQKYKTTLKNEEKRYSLQFLIYENQIYER